MQCAHLWFAWFNLILRATANMARIGVMVPILWVRKQKLWEVVTCPEFTMLVTMQTIFTSLFLQGDFKNIAAQKNKLIKTKSKRNLFYKMELELTYKFRMYMLIGIFWYCNRITTIALATTSSKKAHLIIYFSLMSWSRDSMELSEDLGSFYLVTFLGFALHRWMQSTFPLGGQADNLFLNTVRTV